MQKPSKIILGIDPGTLVLGYGLINAQGNTLSLADMGVKKFSAKKDATERLLAIHTTIKELIEKYKPDCFAIEAPFFGKNIQSMLKLGRAQGVAMATAMSAGLEVFEYSPRKIKQSVTGNGNSDKEQVWKMLQRIVHMPDRPALFDATDAVAVALCHHYATQSPVPAASKKQKGWEAFIKANPERVK
ncbi:MAG: crossover junction endodeoxyribonuclease RuvC [Chitinophagaceae bacterium]